MVLPPVKKMEKEIVSFHKKQEQSHEIIRRFDEVLLEKASKTSIQQVSE